MESSAWPKNIPITIGRILIAKHRLKVWWARRRREELVRTRKGRAHRANFATGVRLSRRPLDRVVAISPLTPTFVPEPVVHALRLVTATLVLNHYDVTTRREVFGALTITVAFVVGGSCENNGKRAVSLRPGYVYVGCKSRPVSHGRHNRAAL